MELPYRWEINQEEIAAQALRFVRVGRSYVPERESNWGIIGPRGRRYYPTVSHDGFLVTDYLLLTKLPNFLADPTHGSENFIVNFGGTHGIAQRAVTLLLSNRALINKVADHLDIDPELAHTWPDAYQVLFRAGDIRHRQARGSHARGLVLVDAVRIDESAEWWMSWNRRIREPLVRWLMSDDGGQ
jgi:hypothetical protein